MPREETQWPKGVSGNPAGRPKGSGEVARLRAAIADHVPAIVEQLRTAALAGDVGAARLLLERVLPPLKAIEEPVRFDVGGQGLSDQGRAVVAAAADGQITTRQSADMLSALGSLARMIEVEELVRRVEVLEADRR